MSEKCPEADRLGAVVRRKRSELGPITVLKVQNFDLRYFCRSGH